MADTPVYPTDITVEPTTSEPSQQEEPPSQPSAQINGDSVQYSSSDKSASAHKDVSCSQTKYIHNMLCAWFKESLYKQHPMDMCDSFISMHFNLFVSWISYSLILILIQCQNLLI